MERNQRRQPRLPFAVSVRIQTDECTMSGETRDISTTGLFLQSETEVPPGTPCRFEIILHSGRLESAIRGEGRVVRLAQMPEGRARGIALRFEDMDVHSQSLLWRVVQYNADAAEKDGGETS